MIWLSPQSLLQKHGIDELEYQSRQWGIVSSLVLVFTAILAMTSHLDKSPKLSSSSMAENIVNLEFRVLQPQPKSVLRPQLEPVPARPEIIEDTQPEEVEEVIQQVREILPEPFPKPTKETLRPQLVKKLKPVSRKKKKLRLEKKQVMPTREQSRPQPVEQLVAIQQLPEARNSAPDREQEPAAYEQAMLDTIPAALIKKKPEYPYRARRMNVTGFVEIRFLVTNKGQVEDLEIIRSRPKGVFETSVRKSVMNWRFTPGVKNGRSVATWITTTINFELE